MEAQKKKELEVLEIISNVGSQVSQSKETKQPNNLIDFGWLHRVAHYSISGGFF